MPVASIAFARGGPESGPNLRSWSNRQRAEVNGEPSSLASVRRLNPSFELRFITDLEPSREQMLLLDRIECTVSMVPCTLTPPLAFQSAFILRFTLSMHSLTYKRVTQLSLTRMFSVYDPEMQC